MAGGGVLKNRIDTLGVGERGLVLAVRPTVADDRDLIVVKHLVKNGLETTAAVERRIIHDDLCARRHGQDGINIEQHFVLVTAGRDAAVHVNLTEVVYECGIQTEQGKVIRDVTRYEGVKLDERYSLPGSVKGWRACGRRVRRFLSPRKFGGGAIFSLELRQKGSEVLSV